MPDTTPRPRRWRKFALIVLIPVGLLALGIALLPTLLSTGPGRKLVLERINRGFEPGRVDFQDLALSWSEPTKLTRFALLDPKGVTVASSNLATLSPNLWQFLTDPPRLGTLTLHHGKLDIERQADGTIDLYEALRSVLQKRNPARDLTIRVESGTLRLRDPSFAEVLNADPADVEVHIPPAPHALTWHVKLFREVEKTGPTSLEISGDLDRWGLKNGGKTENPELHMAVVAKDWRLAIDRSGVLVHSTVDGSIDVLRRAGRWSTQGDLKAGETLVAGPRLNGETLALERLTAAWTLGQEESGWSVRRLDVTSPVGTIRSSGTLNLQNEAAGRQTIEANLDLASLSKSLPHTLRLRDDLSLEKGTANLKIDAELRPNLDLALQVDAGLRDLTAKRAGRTLALREPIRFDAKGGRFDGTWRLDALALDSAFLKVEGHGRPTEAVVFKGSADLRSLQSQVGDWLDLTGVEMSGHSDFEGTYKVADSAYGLDFKTDLRDLRVETNKLPTIARPSIALETKLGGPADSGGLPRGWDSVTAKVRASELSADLTVRPKDRTLLNVVASVQAPIGSGEKAPRGELGLDADWSRADRIVRFARLDLGARATGKGDRPTWAGLSTSGVLDLKKGELLLKGGQNEAPALFAMGPDGLKVSGIGGPAAELKFDGTVTGDLAALESALLEWTGRTPRQMTGRWTLLAQAGGVADGTNISAKLHVDELNWPSKTGEIGEPWPRMTLSAQAVHNRAQGRVELTELAAVSPVAVLQASGRLDLKEDARYVDLKGTLTPDWTQLQARLTQRDPEAKLVATIKPFSVRGPIRSGDTWTERLRSLDADLAVDLQELDLYGLRMGAAPIAVKSRDGKVQIEPIVTTLNEGHVRLEPELDLDSADGPTLRMGKNSIIRDAKINDEVSHRFLRFVAPVLDQATKVNGLVTIDLDRAEFPLGPGFGRKTVVEGAVVFDNVEFGPGPMMDQLLTMMGRREKVVKLDEPVHLSIAEGKIHQRGFALPIANVTRLEMEGWVDFERNMAMVASFPITPTMMGNNGLLSDITAGAKIQVPISGTLDKPKVDDDLFRKQLAETGKGILIRSGPRLAAEILSRIANRPVAVPAIPPPPRPEIVPGDPGLKQAEAEEAAPKDPPKMTASERKAKQLEKRNERRRKRGLPPLP